MGSHPSQASMNFLHVSWMLAGKFFEKPKKFRDHARKISLKLTCILENLVKLACLFENLGRFSLRFEKALKPYKFLEKYSIFYMFIFIFIFIFIFLYFVSKYLSTVDSQQLTSFNLGVPPLKMAVLTLHAVQTKFHKWKLVA